MVVCFLAILDLCVCIHSCIISFCGIIDDSNVQAMPNSNG